MDGYNDTQELILRTLREADEPLVSSDVKDSVQERKDGSISRSGVDNQLVELKESGEIEVVEKVGSGLGTNVYGLTREGKKAVAQLPEEPTAEGGVSEQYVEQLRALREKVMELEETVEEHENRIDELEAQVAGNEEQINTNEEKVEKTARGLQKLRDQTKTAGD